MSNVITYMSNTHKVSQTCQRAANHEAYWSRGRGLETTTKTSNHTIHIRMFPKQASAVGVLAVYLMY
jgi:hypothetical protein